MALGKLLVTLAANTSQFERDMGKAARIAEKNTQQMRAAINKVGAGVAKLTGVATASAGAMLVMAQRQIQVVDAMAKSAKAAGVSAESLQELRFAAERSGASAQQLDDGLRRMTRRIGLAAEGTGPAAKSLERLGIAVTDADGKVRSSEDVFDDFVRAMSGVESQATIAAEASALFGDDAGPKLALLLAEGEKGIASLREEARRFGIVSNEQAAQAELAADAMTNMDAAVSNLSQQFSLSLVPVVTDLANFFAENLTPGFERFQIAANAVGGAVADLAAQFLDLGAAVTNTADSLLSWNPIVEWLAGDTLSDAADGMRDMAEEARVFSSVFGDRAAAAAGRLAVAIGNAAAQARAMADATNDGAQGAQALGEGFEDTGKQANEFEERINDLLDTYIENRREARELSRAIGDVKFAIMSAADPAPELIALLQALNQRMLDLQGTAETARGVSFFTVIFDAIRSASEYAGEALEDWQKQQEAIADSAEAAAERAAESWSAFFQGLVSGDNASAMEALFSTPLFAGQTVIGEDGTEQQTAGLFGQGGQLSPVGSGVQAGLQAAMQGSGTATAVGTALGAAIGSIWGMTQLGAMVGGALGTAFEGNDNPMGRVGFGRPGEGGRYAGTIESPIGMVGIDSGVDGFRHLVNSVGEIMQDFFGQLDQILTPEEMAAVGERLSGASFEVSGSEVENREFLKPILANVVRAMDPVIAGLTDVNAGFHDVEQALERFKSAVALFREAFQTDAIADYEEEVRRANLTLIENIQEIGAEATSLANELDGSAGAMDAVTTSLQGLHAAAMEAYRAIDQASKAISATTEGSVFQLQFNALGNDTGAQIDFLQQRANQLAAELATATDPAQIARLVEQINALTLQAVQLGDPRDLQQNTNEAISFLTAVDEAAQARLEEVREDVRSAYVEAVEDVRTILQEQAQAVVDAANVIAVGGREIGNGGDDINKAVGKLVSFLATGEAPLPGVVNG